MKAPVYVYYELDNFYQNHRRYVKSRSDSQLEGENVYFASAIQLRIFGVRHWTHPASAKVRYSWSALPV